MLRHLTLALVLLATFSANSARAQTNQACPLDERQVNLRLEQIEHGFAQEQRRARWWWYGWLGYAVAEGAIGAVAYTRAHDRLNRDLWLVTWVGSGAFVAELLLFPLVSAFASTRLARAPRSTCAERGAALAQAEHLLDRAADVEREGTNLLAHLLGGAWALGTTGYLVGHNYDFDASARSSHNQRVLVESAIELVWTVAITELAIWTQPMDAVRNRAALPPLRSSPSRAEQARGVPRLFFAAGPGHASLRLVF